MNFHLPVPRQSWDKFVCDALGKPVVFTTNLVVELIQNKDNYAIENKTRLNFHYLVGLSITIPESTPQKITQSLTCAAQSVMAATYLNLRNDTDFVLERLPLLKIQEANNNGYVWQGYAGLVNIAESELVNVDAGSISNSTAVEIIVHYCKFKKQPTIGGRSAI